MSLQQNEPHPPDPTTSRVDDLQRRLNLEKDPSQQAAIYEELAEVLKRIQAACENGTVDLEDLRKTRRSAKEELGLGDDLTPEQVNAEVSRYHTVTKVINELPLTLKTAARDGHDIVRVISLDRSVAYREGFLGLYRMPEVREHLRSPAYIRLWDHLSGQGLEPYIECVFRYEKGHAYSANWVSVKLPR